MSITLPHRAGPQFYNNFLARLRDGELQGCHDNSGALTLSNLFYHYRPYNYSCDLRSDANLADNYVFTFNAEFTPSQLQTNNKSPDYRQMWQDNQLDVFLVFAKDKPGANPMSDVGARSYYQTLNSIVRKFGNGNLGWDLSNPQKFVQLRYETGRDQILNITVMLVEKMTMVTSSEIELIKSYSSKADFVMYNGHAGLGNNTTRFMELVNFTRGKYQLYFLNGCDTFSYYPESAMRRVERTNPGDNASLWVDLISNGMPAYFHTMDSNTVSMIKGLIKQRSSYSELLSDIDDYQNAAVMGEEDNPN